MISHNHFTVNIPHNIFSYNSRVSLKGAQMFHTGWLYIEELSDTVCLGGANHVLSRPHEKNLTNVSVCCITSAHCCLHQTRYLGFYCSASSLTFKLPNKDGNQQRKALSA